MSASQRRQLIIPKGQQHAKPVRPLLTHETACHHLAAGIFGILPSQMSAAEFWTKLSDAFQKDVSDFVTKWPPGKSKERGCYRDLPPADDPDTTSIKPL